MGVHWLPPTQTLSRNTRTHARIHTLTHTHFSTTDWREREADRQTDRDTPFLCLSTFPFCGTQANPGKGKEGEGRYVLGQPGHR